MKIRFKPAALAEFLGFVTERHRIWERRNVLKLPPPWTADPILRKYKFCNVYRELDRGSQYVQNTVINGETEFTHALFGVMIYRVINLPESYELLRTQGLTRLGTFDAKIAARLLIQRSKTGPVFNDAYMLAGTGVHGPGGKIKAYCQVLGRLQHNLPRLTIGMSMENAWRAVQTVKWFGPFVAYQVVLDLYRHVRLVQWIDTDKLFLMGPGAKAGMDRLLDGSTLSWYRNKCWDSSKPMSVRYEDEVYATAITALRDEMESDRESERSLTGRAFDVHDVEFCCCEFRKYINYRRAEKDPKFRVRRRVFREETRSCG